MASRDNQTMQIIVIVLALGFILMSVGLVMVNNSRKTAVAQAKNASDNASESSRVKNELQSEANNYKNWIGYPEADTYQTLQSTFTEDMQRWGPSFEEGDRSFRNILENIFKENHQLARSEADAKAQVKDFKQKLLATEGQKNEQIKEYKGKSDKAQQDKESLRIDFEKHRKEVDQEKDEIASQLAEQRQRIDELLAEHGEDQQTLQKKISALQRVIEVLKSKTAIPDPYAQPEDGRVAWVDQKESKVWINLGDEDHLRPQVTFSVYSGDTNDVNAAVTKGSIEVVRLLGAHLAEARITKDKATRPLMVGDKVYSQVWNRGRQVGFAITGSVDLNDDGIDDLDQLKRIIQLNNGKIDAVPSEEGGIEGQMTVDTRYLILGKYPEAGHGLSKNASAAFQKMSAEADTLNIEVITLEDFLSRMGWHAGSRAVKVGKGARGGDFSTRPEPVFKRRVVNSSRDSFRSRKSQPSY